MARALNSRLLADLHTYWYKSCPAQSPIPKSVMMGWFMPNPEVDEHCRKEYLPALQDAEGMSVEEIRKVAQTADQEVATVILLDQIPRNVFRGMEAAKAYKTFDPKALELAKRLLKEDYGCKSKYDNFAYSMFLYLPLMHSENLSDHDLIKTYLDKRQAQCVSDDERGDMQGVVSFEEKHRKVIERFGRYPSRNAALGRQNTPEEEEFIKDGPGW